MDSVPVEWYCEKFYRRDQLTKDTLRMVQNQTLDVLPDEDVLNIALVGLTGAGKSYFGNALLGSMSPGIGSYFKSKATQASVTSDIKGQTGILFGGHYDKELGLSKPQRINVYDTPGFDDSDKSQLEKNKLLISTTLKYDIDVVLLIIPQARMDQNNQIALKMLNDWTFGQVWNNLIIVKARTEFGPDKIEERKFGPTRNEMKDNSETVNIIQKEIDRDGVWLYGRMEGNSMVEA